MNCLLKNKNASNALWLISGKIIQAILGFVVSIFTARYLGPSNYGLISYAASVVAFVTPIMQLGFNSVLVQEITLHPNEEGKILGSSIMCSLLSGIVCLIGIFCFTLIANPGERDTTIVCVLYGLMLFPSAFELIIYWFQAKLKSKYTAIVSLIAYIIVSGYKIFLLATAQKVYWFAISYSIDYIIIAISMFVIYKKFGGQRLSFSSTTIKRLISRSWYFIISGLAVVVYAQTDKIMLKLMLGDSATGIYTSAVTIAGMASFVYSAIIDSLRPTIFDNKANASNDEYEKKVVLLYSIVVYLALAQSVVMTFLAYYLVKIMYGMDYIAAVPALQIIVWYTAFSYYGGSKDVWILAEGKQKYLIWLNISGAIANIALNAILIPVLGVNGAALASLVTQFFTNIVMMIIIKPLRHNQMLLLKALNPMVIIRLFKIKEKSQ
ncbi:MAG: flippase [Ruminococcus sp.]